ncbi:Sec62/63 complex, subunit Sec66 [Phycomyces nitens]|nr:Sec62/63 complex, subunit Sec66 [Phycomyces nitens]
MNSLVLPAIYLGGCIAAMSAFSYLYRRATNFQPIEPWFPENVEKEQYIALLNCETPVPEHHLKAALLRRAMEAVRRLVQVQQEKPALQQLMRTGSIGDDLWRDFGVAEQDIMAELQEVVGEANTYKENWGQTIFSTAAQMLEHEKQKAMLVEMKELKEVEEKKRKAMEKDLERDAKRAEEELLREEEEEKKKAKGKK